MLQLPGLGFRRCRRHTFPAKHSFIMSILSLRQLERSTVATLVCLLSLVCTLRIQQTAAWTPAGAQPPDMMISRRLSHAANSACISGRRRPNASSDAPRPVARVHMFVHIGERAHCGHRLGRTSARPTSSTPPASLREGKNVRMMSDHTVSSKGYTVTDDGKCDLKPLPSLKNRYFALRHGQSVANMEGVISSNPEVGAVSHGLTSNGRAQARAAATALIEVVGRDKLDSLVFVSSNFLRARQTAEECRAALLNILSFEREASRGDEGADGDEARMPPGASIGGYDVSPPVVIRHELRERSFGELDATTLVNYNKVWPEDLKDGTSAGFGVESVCDVAARIAGLVQSLEGEFEDASIVFSSHADTLQIAQCHIAGADERLFSQYRFKNGEVRSLVQDPESLPPPNPLSFK